MCEICGCGFVQGSKRAAKLDAIPPKLAAIPVVVIEPPAESAREQTGEDGRASHGCRVQGDGVSSMGVDRDTDGRDCTGT